MRKNFGKFISIFVAVIVAVGCGEKIPVKEMSLAKMEISRANTVMAEKYAPEEIAEAKKKLTESHGFVKEESFDKAKTAAVESYDKAKEAYDKSAPLLARDTLDIANESLEKAVEVYAEVLAESEYNQANDALNEANALFEQKKYYDSYKKALEADGLAKEARNVAIGKKDILGNSIAEVKATLDEAVKYNAETFAPEKVELANDNTRIAEESLESLQLKKGFAAVELAGMNADEAYLIALQGTAVEKSQAADKMYQEARNSDGAKIATDELNGAGEALDQSKELLNDSKYKESILSSDESLRLSMVVLNAMNEVAKEKIANAEMVYYQAKVSPGAAIAVDELKGAEEALNNSRSLLEESKANESISQAEESERLSYIVINTKGKGGGASTAAVSGKGKGSGSDAGTGEFGDYYIYKVRYIPERRDCLWRIAEKYYENGFLWKRIYRANTEKINNPDLIWPDMLIKVPKMRKRTSPVKETSDEETNAAPPEKEAVPVEQEENPE
ncbi:MAG: LysM peptidoglycan-binding domain-containing protein [Spirochaetes bacterium]|nr:LysM peptidoglycan-binding domain-containing protein [Spirochaetota bacterium]